MNVESISVNEVCMYECDLCECCMHLSLFCAIINLA
jgi:hypothetical protein